MRTATVFALLAVALAVSAAAGVLVGAVPIAPGDVISALFGAEGRTADHPRAAFAARARSGTRGRRARGGRRAAAGMLRTRWRTHSLPARPGASLGAVLAVATGLEPALVPLAAFAGAMGAIALVWRLARLGGRTTVLTVLLAVSSSHRSPAHS